MTAIDQDAILMRATNAARIAVAEWEAENRATLSQHERQLFAFAFAAGIAQGVREARVTTEEPVRRLPDPSFQWDGFMEPPKKP